MPEPALEFAALSTKAASEKKPETLQCSISAEVEGENEDDEELRPVPDQDNLQAFQRSLLVSSGHLLSALRVACCLVLNLAPFCCVQP